MKIDNILKEEKINHWEGSRGVQNLCVLVNRLGYKDRQYFGQFGKGCYGDLINFLEDNPGAVEAVTEFIREHFDEEEDEDDEE